MIATERYIGFHKSLCPSTLIDSGWFASDDICCLDLLAVFTPLLKKWCDLNACRLRDWSSSQAVDHMNELVTLPAARAGVDIDTALANHSLDNCLFEVLISVHGHNWSLKPIGWKQYKTPRGKARGVDCRYLSPDKTSHTSPRRKAGFSLVIAQKQSWNLTFHNLDLYWK